MKITCIEILGVDTATGKVCHRQINPPLNQKNPFDFAIKQSQKKMKKLLKATGIFFAVFYGWFSIVMLIIMTILASVPMDWLTPTIVQIQVWCSSPYWFFPFWWVIVSMIGGSLAMFVLLKYVLKWRPQ